LTLAVFVTVRQLRRPAQTFSIASAAFALAVDLLFLCAWYFLIPFVLKVRLHSLPYAGLGVYADVYRLGWWIVISCLVIKVVAAWLWMPRVARQSAWITGTTLGGAIVIYVPAMCFLGLSDLTLLQRARIGGLATWEAPATTLLILHHSGAGCTVELLNVPHGTSIGDIRSSKTFQVDTNCGERSRLVGEVRTDGVHVAFFNQDRATQMLHAVPTFPLVIPHPRVGSTRGIGPPDRLPVVTSTRAVAFRFPNEIWSAGADPVTGVAFMVDGVHRNGFRLAIPWLYTGFEEVVAIGPSHAIVVMEGGMVLLLDGARGHVVAIRSGSSILVLEPVE